MSHRILVFYGSYRSGRMGIRLAGFVVERLRRRGDAVELIDAQGDQSPDARQNVQGISAWEAPEPLEQLAGKIRDADGFLFVTGEYSWGVQPGLKNLTDHGGVVLAAGCDRELFGRTPGRAGLNRLARHTLRDGTGGDFKHNCRWSYRTNPHG